MMKMLYKESLMRMRYPLMVASTIFMLLACSGSSEQMKKNPEIKVDSSVDSLSIKTRTPDEISAAVPELKEPLDESVMAKTRDLKQHLVMNGVPGEWFDEQLQHETFQIHPHYRSLFSEICGKAGRL
jgi:hypothetical protein